MQWRGRQPAQSHQHPTAETPYPTAPRPLTPRPHAAVQIVYSKKDEVALLLYGANDTCNELNEADPEQYRHVSVLQPLGKVRRTPTVSSCPLTEEHRLWGGSGREGGGRRQWCH